MITWLLYWCLVIPHQNTEKQKTIEQNTTAQYQNN